MQSSQDGWWLFAMLIVLLVYFTESEIAICSRLSTAVGFGILGATAALVASVLIFSS